MEKDPEYEGLWWVLDLCPDCSGSGVREAVNDCPRCGGDGMALVPWDGEDDGDDDDGE